MSKNSFFSTTFITTLTSLILVPISFIIGFYLSNIFDAPELSIKYIVPEPELDLKISEQNHKNIKNYFPQFREIVKPLSLECENSFIKNKFNKTTLMEALEITQRTDELIKDWFNRIEKIKK